MNLWTSIFHLRAQEGQEELLHIPGSYAILLFTVSDLASITRSKPTSQKLRLWRHRRARRSYSMFKVRRGSHEEIPLVQGKEQWLRFAGAAVKRYPTSKVKETQVRL